MILLKRMVSDRETLVYLPDDYLTRTTPTQVLLALHPHTYDAAGFQNMARLETRPGAANMVIVYPNGLGKTWDGASPIASTNSGDEAYLLAVFADVATLLPVKPKFALTGFSAGALMVYKMICNQGPLISAAVPHAAYKDATAISDSTVCAWTNKKVPILHMHGTGDKAVNPITGDGDADHLYGFDTIGEWMAAVVVRNSGRVTPKPNFANVTAALTGETLTTLSTSTSYVLIEGLAHIWPGSAGSDAVLAFVSQY